MRMLPPRLPQRLLRLLRLFAATRANMVIGLTSKESRDYRAVIVFLCLCGASPLDILSQVTGRCLRLGARSQQHLVSGGADGGDSIVDVSTASDAGCLYSICVTWGSTVRAIMQ